MKETRQDAWTKEEDQLLAETVLQYIKNGNTQLEAFKNVAEKLIRTPAACGFRWNATIRKQYESAIAEAKEERKKASSQALRALQAENTNENYVIESAIQLLEKLKIEIPEEIDREEVNKQKQLLEELRNENSKLEKQLERYRNAWIEMEKLWNWVAAREKTEV